MRDVSRGEVLRNHVSVQLGHRVEDIGGRGHGEQNKFEKG